MHFGSSTQWVLGFPDRANQLAQDSIALARRLSHAPSLANALWRACDVFALRDDLAAVMTTATELIGLTDVHGLPMPRIYGLEFLGWALTRSGRVAEGIRRMEEAEGLLVRIGTSVQAALALGLRAEALLTAERYAEGLVQANRALATSTQCGERADLSRIHRLRSVLLRHLRGSADPEVAASLETALTIARQQDAKGWEIGAATDLAQLWAEQGRRAEAYALLAPVYGWFTQGFETADLKDAKALLTDLG